MQYFKLFLCITIFLLTWLMPPAYSEPINAEHYYLKANQYLIKGNIDSAIENYNLAIKYNPNVFKYHFELGFAYHNKEEFGKAIKEYKFALKFNFNDAETHYNLGTALLSKGDIDSAINEFKTTLKLNSKYVNAYVNLGTALAKQGKIDEALIYYQMAQKFSPNNNNLEENIRMTKEIKKYGKILVAPPPLPTATPFKTQIIKPTPTPAEMPTIIPKLIETPTPTFIHPSESPAPVIDSSPSPDIIPSSIPIEIPSPIVTDYSSPSPSPVTFWTSPWLAGGMSVVLPGSGSMYTGIRKKDYFGLTRGIGYGVLTGLCYWQMLESKNKGQDTTLWLIGIEIATLISTIDAFFSSQ